MVPVVAVLVLCTSSGAPGAVVPMPTAGSVALPVSVIIDEAFSMLQAAVNSAMLLAVAVPSVVTVEQPEPESMALASLFAVVDAEEPPGPTGTNTAVEPAK